VNIRFFTEIALSVALAAVLGLIKIPLPHLLYGGSVSLEGVPLLVVAFRHGGRAGLVAGAVYGLIDFLLKPIVVHPIQVFLDYPLAFGLLGFGGGWGGGLGRGREGEPNWKLRIRGIVGISAGNGLRLLVHFLSGMVFFASYAPEGQPIWLYSLTYNASYIIPQVVFHILLLQTMLKIIILKPK
jgi:thiamine transporter